MGYFMKQKIVEGIRITIYIWMGIQIVLGLGWALLNVGKLPDFADCRELLAMSENLVVDEYTGFLYPFLLRLLNICFSWSKVPVWTVMYVLQIVVAYVAYYYFLRKILVRKQEKWQKTCKTIPLLSLYILTVPVILQVHMAILPYSLASSLLLILMGKLSELWETGEVTLADWIKIAVLWIGSAQICTEYAWFSGLAVGMAAVGIIWKKRKMVWKPLLFMLICILSIAGFQTMLQTPGSQGKIQKSWQACLMTRVVWPNYSRFSYFWMEEIHDRWNGGALRELSTYPENVIYEFGPGIEELFGQEEANNIYYEMAKRTFQLDTRNIVSGMVKEGVAYLCPPVTAYLQLHGVGASYTGWNYGRMKDNAPVWTKYYVECALSGWIYMGLCCMVSLILKGSLNAKGFMKEKKKRRKNALYCGSILLGVDLWYLMTYGNMQDYKRVIVCSVLWTSVILVWLVDIHKKSVLK